MNMFPKINLDDPIGFYRRYSMSQYFVMPGFIMATPTLAGAGAGAGGISAGSAILGGAGIEAVGELAGGILASKGAGGKTKARKISTFSGKQKEINRLIFDFLMGIRRDEKGRELGRSPLLRTLANRKIPKRRVAPLTGSQQDILTRARGMTERVGTRRRPDPYRQQQLAEGILPTDAEFKKRPRYLKHGGKVKPGEKAIVGDDGAEIIEALPGGGVEVIPNPKTMSSPQSIAAAMANAQEIENRTGMRALQTGTQRRYLEDPTSGAKTYLPYEFGGGYGELYAEPESGVQRGFEELKASEYGTARGDYLTGKLFGDRGRVGFERAKQFGSEDLLGEIATRRAGGAKPRDIEDWLTEQYNIAGAEFGSGAFALPEEKRLGGEYAWWENLQDKYGGDITTVPYKLRGAKLKPERVETTVPSLTGRGPGRTTIEEIQPGYNVIQEGYLRGLQEYWKTLPTVTGNEQLDAVVGGMPEEIKAGFGAYIDEQFLTGDPPSPIAANPWLMKEGQWTFNDPFGVDMGNVTKWASDYMQSKGYELNPDYDPQAATAIAAGEAVVDPEVNVADQWTKPAAEAAVGAPVDYSGLVSTLAGPEGMTEETRGAVNAHLKNWKGGVLSDIEMNYNRTTGQYEFGTMYGNEWVPAPTNIEAALSQAVGDYTAGDIAAAPEPDAGVVPEVGEDLLRSLEPILSGIVGAEFDPERDLELFEAGVAVPAARRFREYSVPAIESALGGGAIRSSARENYIEQGQRDLDEYLISEQADWMRNAEDTFENRRQLGINQAMTLATLPTEIANAKISGQATRAMIANTFNNMDINNAIAESNITNAELAGLVTLWTMFSGEQQQTNDVWAAEFANAFIGEGPIPFDQIMGLLSGFQAEAQTAIVTEEG